MAHFKEDNNLDEPIASLKKLANIVNPHPTS